MSHILVFLGDEAVSRTSVHCGSDLDIPSSTSPTAVRSGIHISRGATKNPSGRSSSPQFLATPQTMAIHPSGRSLASFSSGSSTSGKSQWSEKFRVCGTAPGVLKKSGRFAAIGEAGFDLWPVDAVSASQEEY